MSDILAEICAAKARHVALAKGRMSAAVVAELAKIQTPPRGFAAALDAKALSGPALIAEIKKASPSAGIIRRDFDPVALAQAYHRAGAACLSVLTDVPYFQGDDSYIAAVRSIVPLPVLRKDFLIDPWQIGESRALGADCILLILAALSDAQAREMESAAHEFGMDVLLEVHDEAEFERAIVLQSPLIGVNNRDLKTMTTDLATTERLAAILPPGKQLVSESGLKTPADLARMAKVGAKRYLIGESLMRESDVQAATEALLRAETR